MVSQFVSSHDVRLLKDLDFEFPVGTHAIGRLDQNSEGLLLLTTNKKITRLLFQADEPHERTYLVQVVYAMSESDLDKLRAGLGIPSKRGTEWQTKPCKAKFVPKPENFWQAGEEIPEFVPSSWIELSLVEGKFHQVRKMVRALNYRCRRLIRTSIEDLTLDNLLPGEVKEINEKEFFKRLKLKEI